MTTPIKFPYDVEQRLIGQLMRWADTEGEVNPKSFWLVLMRESGPPDGANWSATAKWRTDAGPVAGVGRTPEQALTDLACILSDRCRVCFSGLAEAREAQA